MKFRVNRKNAPCYKCPDRDPGCHGNCERYKQWLIEDREAGELVKAAERQEQKTFFYERSADLKEKVRETHHRL